MAESIKQVFDIRPGKGMSDGQSNEHQRNWTERGWEWATRHGNYDRTRERLNFEIAKGGKVVPVDKSMSIGQRMAESLRSRGIKDPNEGVSEPGFRTVANIIFGGSRERMHTRCSARRSFPMQGHCTFLALYSLGDISYFFLKARRKVESELNPAFAASSSCVSFRDASLSRLSAYSNLTRFIKS